MTAYLQFMRLSPILRQATDNKLLFWCPGCDGCHGIKVGEGPGPRWGWNGDVNKPTFTPSILVTYHDLADPKDNETCHSFVTDGRIAFLGDCTHDLVGQTVDMPPFDQTPIHWAWDDYIRSWTDR